MSLIHVVGRFTQENHVDFIPIDPLSRWIRLIVLLHCTCLAVLASGCAAGSTERANQPDRGLQEGEMAATPAAVDPLEATYIVGDREVRLHQGDATQPTSLGGATLIRTCVFGCPEYGDVNGDGLDDAVLFLQHDPGGSGTFYYVAVALFNGHGWEGTRAMLLGDRIVPRSIVIRDGVIIANYLGRRPDEPFGRPPTVEMSRHLIVQDHRIKTLP